MIIYGYSLASMPDLVHLEQIMLDTIGPELQVFNKSGKPIALEADAKITITPDTTKEASSELLPINYADIAKAILSDFTAKPYSFRCFWSFWLRILFRFCCIRLSNRETPYFLDNTFLLEVRTHLSG